METEKPEMYHCVHCNKSLSSATSLDKHFKTQAHNSVVAASMINLLTAEPWTSCITSNIVHPDEQTVVFEEVKCVDCNKVFSRQCHLTQHRNTHHSGEKLFKCIRCGKRFATEESCSKHYARHIGDKPYKCQHCSKQFNHPISLRRHSYQHDQSNPFVCEICGKGFTRNDHLMTHLEMHNRKI